MKDAQTQHNIKNDTQVTICKKDGSHIQVDINPSVIIRNNKITGTRGIVRELTEQKKYESILKEEKDFLVRIFASIQDGISILDKDLTIREVNKTMERLYAPSMPLIGKKCYEAYHHRNEPCIVCPTLRVFETGQPASETVPKDPEGIVKGWVDVYSFPLMNTEKGEMQGVIEYVRDVTEKKNYEDALKESERRFKALADSAPYGIFELDMSGKCIYVNKKLMETFKVTEEDVFGDKWLLFSHPDDRAKLTRMIAKASIEKQLYTIENRIIDRRGSIHWLIMKNAPIIDERDRIHGWVGMLLDETNEKLATIELTASEERFRIAVNSITDLVWEWDIITGHLEWFGDIDYFLGFEKSEFPRTIDAWEKIIHPKDHDRVMKALDEHLKNNTPYREEYRVIGKNNRLRYWLDCGTAIFDDSGKAVRMVGACSDITEKKLVEEQVNWQNTLLEAVNTILQETIFSENDEDVVHAFLLTIMNLTNSDYGFLGEINKKGELEHLYFNASDIEPRALPDNARDLMIKGWKERGIWDTVIKNGKSFSANDIKSYLTEIKVKPSHPDVIAFLAVPLKYTGSPNGILAIARKSHEYNDYDIQALEGISGIFTEVLNVKRLETQLKKRVEVLESKTKVNKKINKKNKRGRISA